MRVRIAGRECQCRQKVCTQVLMRRAKFTLAIHDHEWYEVLGARARQAQNTVTLDMKMTTVATLRACWELGPRLYRVCMNTWSCAFA